MLERRIRGDNYGESLSTVEINEVVLIAQHQVRRAGMSNGRQCDSVLGRITTIYVDGSNQAIAIAKCESCGHSEELSAAGRRAWTQQG